MILMARFAAKGRNTVLSVRQRTPVDAAFPRPAAVQCNIFIIQAVQLQTGGQRLFQINCLGTAVSDARAARNGAVVLEDTVYKHNLQLQNRILSWSLAKSLPVRRLLWFTPTRGSGK